jgi:enterochelin esterase-like enzyme
MDVIEDIRRHYNIDDDKIFLTGLSNGAVASYRVGLGHAWRFAAVLPMSGIVDWEAHASGGASGAAERNVLRNESSLCSCSVSDAAELIVAINDPRAEKRVVSSARKLAPDLNIIVRTRFLDDVPELPSAGATKVVPVELEAATEIVCHLLRRRG